jgi:hypothetical protein
LTRHLKKKKKKTQQTQVLLKHQIITIILLHFPLRQVENKEIAPAQISTITARPNAAGTA